MADSLSFSPATPDDIETLVAMRLAFLEEVNGAPAPAPLESELRAYFSHAVQAGEFVAHLARHENQVVATSGLVVLRKPPSYSNFNGREGYIMNMYTLPAWRGRGIAARLLDAVITAAQAALCCRLSLHAESRARPVYERAGFVASAKEMTLDFVDSHGTEG